MSSRSLETGTDERGAYARCNASLWCDGIRIYTAEGLGMRIVSGPPASSLAAEEPSALGSSEGPDAAEVTERLDPNVEDADDITVTLTLQNMRAADALDLILDHTDLAKKYTAYEWWQNQRLADLFQNPGFFTSFYVYEREQKWPWGHRNVVFADRGGPIVYINRKNYLSSPWAEKWPVDPKGRRGMMLMRLPGGRG